MFITLMVLCSTLTQLERECSDVNFPRLSIDCPCTIYTSHLPHMPLFSVFFSTHRTYWDYVFLFFLFSVKSTRGKTASLCTQCSCQPAYVPSFYLFLEEALVICRELLLSCKSNFRPPDKMCSVHVYMCFECLPFFQHLHYIWACEYRRTHANLGICVHV